ncbi:NAD(P)/FAD-dependent oxidoreductase [Bizionia myxarmorum]|uniref:NAD(P)/FAD-dependent oxidoreductase n=1 Tax=Bizionia myxarmorum TaxID=291186 RepID=A0A5D0RDT1_9FLAO|nr:FAD-dependent oxidoreductase [Bizionia myxarmorum]TYB79136.1 NAD(P)/FAD-dependent oxidoreductase [Bizionia myxarmorum]
MEHVVIIGNGISGVTAARHIRKLSKNRITIISAETEHFFSRTALMYIYMGHMKYEHTKPYEDWFWEKNRIELKSGFVNNIDTRSKTLHFAEGDSLKYDKLIVATGSKPNKFGWPGQDLKGVQGLYSKQDLDNLEIYAPDQSVCKRAVIVGGGLIGIELSEMLHSRNIPVTFLVREPSFWDNVLPKGDSELINHEIKKHGIDLRLATNLKEIKSDENGRVKSVIIEETGEEILCDFVGLTAGVSPNISIVKNSDIETKKGVLVNRYLETNIPDVYAIGDCAEQHEPIGERKSIEAVWYTGRMMGEVVAQTICGNRMAYNPSHWFNSAKFFDIEYQTYGWVFSEPKENHAHFHWKHENEDKCITIEYNDETQEFKGINTLGIRMKHEIFNRWLSENQSVDYVIKHLSEANFDPEFFKRFESNIQKQFENRLHTV